VQLCYNTLPTVASEPVLADLSLRSRGFPVSEFERPRPAASPFIPAPRSDAFVADVPSEPESFDAPSPFQREGLPPGYRMRHDRHYVDQLTTRSAGPQVRVVPISDIDAASPPGRRDITALVRSIAAHGVLQPLLVRPAGGRFELIAGAQRLAAAAAAGLTEVPCLVHQVDEPRALVLADADNTRAAAPPVTRQEPEPSADAKAAGLAEISRSFSAIASCLHLLSDRDVALRDRVALDLVRTEVHRAGRLVQSLTLLADEPALSHAQVSLPDLFGQVADGFAPERRLSGTAVTVESSGSTLAVRADRDWLAVGLAGALGGMLALVDGTREASVTVRMAPTASGASVTVEVEQRSAPVPSWALARFFDPEWTDRPGGYQAAIELAAARRTVELHGGGAEVVAGERGGCRLVMVLPAG
jgi:ParB-like chromosome segregation protein Spo0J